MPEGGKACIVSLVEGGGRRDMFIEERRKGGWRESGVLMSNERGWRRGREDGSRVRQPSEITK
jgi:hypothetical protein